MEETAQFLCSFTHMKKKKQASAFIAENRSRTLSEKRLAFTSKNREIHFGTAKKIKGTLLHLV